MEMIEAYLRRFLDHPKRRTIVILITCGVAMLTVWPAVDKYCALRKQEIELLGSLEEAQNAVSVAEQQQQMATKFAGELEELEQRGVSDVDVSRFKTEISQMVRDAGCTARKLDVAAPLKRAWRNTDDPLTLKFTGPAGAAEETPYQLRSQQMNLTVVGEAPKVLKLLADMQKTKRLIHTEEFRLSPARAAFGPDQGARNQVQLELKLVLFNLETEKKTPEKKPA